MQIFPLSRLAQEKEEYEMAKGKLEYELESAKRMLDEQRSQLDVLKRQTMSDSQEKARVVSKLRHNIVTEREELIKELDSLRNANKKLRDESDAIKHSPQTSKRGSIIGNYLFTNDPNPEITSLTSPEASHEAEVDDSYYHEKAQTSASQARRLLKSIQEHVPVPVDNSLHKELEMATNCRTKNDVSNDQYKSNSNGPERIFKVVCVGDSGVGKTCFLHRFCHNKFRQTFSATIGVDFQVKSLNIDGRIIALQLWDTAGQERFRSITKQYFRKADGVLLVYDVTSELSFLNMRNWMQSVKVSAKPFPCTSLFSLKDYTVLDVRRTQQDKENLF
uniref:Ras and EF-hand domain-containing protein n=1 Tax=Romanomermis culicivorax TaxID=13658 RepID=A0A915J7T2_ROMCU